MLLPGGYGSRGCRTRGVCGSAGVREGGTICAPGGRRLRPGMRIKRWVGLFLLGTVLTGLAIAMGLVYAYRYFPFPTAISGLVSLITLQFLPRELRFVLVLLAGAAGIVVGFLRLHQSLMSPFLAHTRAEVRIWRNHRRRASLRTVASRLAQRRRHRRRHRAVDPAARPQALHHQHHRRRHRRPTTAAVRPAAERARHSGRRATSATAWSPWPTPSRWWSELFQYRFDARHPSWTATRFGNLFIVAMTQVTGSFEQAVHESSQRARDARPRAAFDAGRTSR